MTNEEEFIKQLKEKFQEVRDGKIHWLKVAPLLEEAKLKELRPRTILDSQGRIWEILSAYTFLKAQRPEFLKNPNLNVSAEAISYLKPIYKSMSKEDREKNFQILVDDVLNGKTRINTLRIMAKTKKVSQGKDLPTTTNIAPDRTPRDIEAHKIKAIENAIDILDYLLDIALSKMSHNELRKHLEIKSHNLSIRLSCIANEDFLKAWKEKKEVII